MLRKKNAKFYCYFLNLLNNSFKSAKGENLQNSKVNELFWWKEICLEKNQNYLYKIKVIFEEFFAITFFL